MPFASSWKPGAVAWGVIAFWMLLGIELTSLFMKRIPKVWWRRIHLTSYAVAAMTTIHLFTAGTDATTAALRWTTIAVEEEVPHPRGRPHPGAPGRLTPVTGPRSA